MGWFGCSKKSKREAAPFAGTGQEAPNYRFVMTRINAVMADPRRTPREKKEFLRFAIDVVGADIESSGLARVFYEDPQGGRNIHNFFPVVSLPAVPQTEILCLRNKRVLSFPYSLQKLADAKRDLKMDGQFLLEDRSVPTGFFVPELNLVLLQNSIHHTAVAHLRDGSAMACVDRHPIQVLLPLLRVSEDGQFWEGPDFRLPILDHRLAVVYELGRLLYPPEEKAP